MLTTYEEIDAEWERLAADLGRTCPPEEEATMKAFMQHRPSLPAASDEQLLAVTK